MNDYRRITEAIVCRECGGEGSPHPPKSCLYGDCVPHPQPYESGYEACPVCGGSGLNPDLDDTEPPLANTMYQCLIVYMIRHEAVPTDEPV